MFSNPWDSQVEEIYRTLAEENPHFNSDFEIDILVEAYLRDVHYTSRTQAVLNVVYSTFNIGVVALPFVAEEAGLPLFITALILISVSSAYTTCMVINMANEHGVKSLEDLAEKAFGSKGFVLVCCCEIIFSVCLMVVTLNVWADICTNVLHSFTDADVPMRLIAILVGSAINIPISLLARSMSSLSWASYCIILAMIAALIALVVTFFINSTEHSDEATVGTVQELMRPKSLWWSLGLVVVFCFGYSQKVFAVYCCLRRRNSQRWNYVVTRAHAILTFFYFLVGLIGCIHGINLRSVVSSGGEEDFDYFMRDYDAKGSVAIVLNILRLLMAFSLLLTLPVNCLVACTTLRRLYHRCTNRHDSNNSVTDVLVPFTYPKSLLSPDANCSDGIVPATPQSGREYRAPSPNLDTTPNPRWRRATFEDDQRIHAAYDTWYYRVGSTSSQSHQSSSRYGDLRHSFPGNSREDIHWTAGAVVTDSVGWKSLSHHFDSEDNDDTEETRLNTHGGAEIKSERLLGHPSTTTATTIVDDLSHIQRTTIGSVRKTEARTEFDFNPTSRVAWENYTKHRHQFPSESEEETKAEARTDYDRGRESSLASVMDKPLPKSCWGAVTLSLPTIAIWTIVILMNIFYGNFGVFAITVGPMMTAALGYLLPSMTYFRLGYDGDYAAIPVYGFIPNRARMWAVQLLGLLLIGSTLTIIIYIFISMHASHFFAKK